MIVQLALAFGLTCVTVVVHALGTVEAVAHLVRAWKKENGKQSLLALGLQLIRVVSVLLLLHLLEAAVWGGAYWLLEILPDLETAAYFSMTSYTTVGFGDVVLPAPWRLLGPIEAAVGIFMFGWSTGIMVAAITRIHGDRLRLLMERQNQDDEPPRAV